MSLASPINEGTKKQNKCKTANSGFYTLVVSTEKP